MASQVKPGSIQPKRQLGLQQSAQQMRHRPAHSIRARELLSHTQAECKGAFFSRDPELKISLGMQGRPCKLASSFLSPLTVRTGRRTSPCRRSGSSGLWHRDVDWYESSPGRLRRSRATALPLPASVLACRANTVIRSTSGRRGLGQRDHLQGRITPGGDGILAIPAIVASAHRIFRRIFLAINGQRSELFGRHLSDRRLMAESHRGKVGGVAPAAGR